MNLPTLIWPVLLGVVVGMAFTKALICGQAAVDQWFAGDPLAKSPHGWHSLGWFILAVMLLAAGLTAMSV